MKLNELPCSVIESESLRELMGLRVCIAIVDDLRKNEQLDTIRLKMDARIYELLESEV